MADLTIRRAESDDDLDAWNRVRRIDQQHGPPRAALILDASDRYP